MAALPVIRTGVPERTTSPARVGAASGKLAHCSASPSSPPRSAISRSRSSPSRSSSDAMVAPTASALCEVMIRERASRSSARTSSPVTRASIASRPPSSRASRSRWPSGEKSMITQSTPLTPPRSRSGVQDTSASWVLPSPRGSSTRPCQASPASTWTSTASRASRSPSAKSPVSGRPTSVLPGPAYAVVATRLACRTFPSVPTARAAVSRLSSSWAPAATGPGRGRSSRHRRSERCHMANNWSRPPAWVAPFWGGWPGRHLIALAERY